MCWLPADGSIQKCYWHLAAGQYWGHIELAEQAMPPWRWPPWSTAAVAARLDGSHGWAEPAGSDMLSLID